MRNPKQFRRMNGASVNQKIVSVNDNLGIKGIGNQQGTTRIIYDSIKLQTSANNSVINFFENVKTRQFPYTNLTENKLQVAEAMGMQRISFLIMEVDVTAPATPKIVSLNTLSALAEFKPLYRSDLNFQIAQDTVVKRLPLQSFYAPFNRNSSFIGSPTFGTNPGITSSFEISHDVFHFDNPIIIPPQIEFVAPLQIPAITLPATANREWYLMCTLEGLGSLFAPKSTY